MHLPREHPIFVISSLPRADPEATPPILWGRRMAYRITIGAATNCVLNARNVPQSVAKSPGMLRTDRKVWWLITMDGVVLV